jgi:hypothetical protein
MVRKKFNFTHPIKKIYKIGSQSKLTAFNLSNCKSFGPDFGFLLQFHRPLKRFFPSSRRLLRTMLLSETKRFLDSTQVLVPAIVNKEAPSFN